MYNSESIRIAICDDHPVIRFGLSAILNNVPNLSVVLEASTSTQLLSKFSELKPDITILDLDLDGESGIDCLREIRKVHKSSKVIIYTAFSEHESLAEIMDLKIQGYILKRSDYSDILTGIKVVNEGGLSIEPKIVTALLSQIRNNNSTNNLSRRENQVLELLAKGKTNSDIADSLCVCERTVKYHVSSILGKLNIKNRTEAAIYAKNNNMFPA